MSRRVKEEKVITVAEARELLKSFEPELDQFQRRTLDYTEKFSKINASAASELVNRLVSEFDVERDRAVQLANCMHESVEEASVFFAGGKRRLITTAQLTALLKLLDVYRKK